jgi:hypothetical protein
MKSDYVNESLEINNILFNGGFKMQTEEDAETIFHYTKPIRDRMIRPDKMNSMSFEDAMVKWDSMLSRVEWTASLISWIAVKLFSLRAFEMNDH